MRIAIVEDERGTRLQTVDYCKRFQKENGIEFDVVEFSDGKELVDAFDPSFDMIFLDIEMKTMNGLEAAQEIRKRDKNVLIIFITNMAGYAIQGYGVHAADYILKPVSFPLFDCKMREWVNRAKQVQEESILITNGDNVLRLSTAHLLYVEVDSHRVIYHTVQGDHAYWGSLKSAERQLEGKGFARCNSCYLVNLRYVEKIEQNMVTVGNVDLQISRPKKKEFLEAVTRFLGGM